MKCKYISEKKKDTVNFKKMFRGARTAVIKSTPVFEGSFFRKIVKLQTIQNRRVGRENQLLHAEGSTSTHDGSCCTSIQNHNGEALSYSSTTVPPASLQSFLTYSQIHWQVKALNLHCNCFDNFKSPAVSIVRQNQQG